MNFFKKIIKAVIQKIAPELLWGYTLTKHGYSEMGWLTSVLAERPVDKNNAPLPWITYSSIHFLLDKFTKLDTSTLNIFEYGSGSSTLWWSLRVKNVISVEHDKVWYDKMKPSFAENIDYRFIPLDGGGGGIVKKLLNMKTVLI